MASFVFWSSKQAQATPPGGSGPVDIRSKVSGVGSQGQQKRGNTFADRLPPSAVKVTPIRGK